jgi:hypothetical protein
MKCLTFAIGFAFLITLAVAFIPAVHAELISVDPCQGSIFINQKNGFFNFYSKCFTVSIAEDYSGAVFQDEYSKAPFELFIISYQDVNAGNPAEFKEFLLRDLGMTGKFNSEGDGVVFTSADGMVRVNYFVDGNKFEVSYEQDKWASGYANGMLVVNTIATSDAKATATFVSKPAEVDSIKQPLSVSKEKVVDKDYIKQVAFVGSSFEALVLDPIYQVDYSPIPASHLITGNVSSFNDTLFAQMVNITNGVSDGNDSTAYITRAYTNTTNSSAVLDNFECNGFNCGYGWVSNWSAVGACDIRGDGAPIDSYHFRASYTLALGQCNASRGLNLSGKDACNITFWAKAAGLEAGKFCMYQYYNGTSLIQLMNITDGGDDNTYRPYSFDICSRGVSADSAFVFNASGASAAGDNCFIDNISMSQTVFNMTNGTAIVGRWNVVYDPLYMWFLMVKKTSSGSDTIRVNAYNSNDSVNSTQKVNSVLSGIGWFNMNVSGLLDYENNTALLNFTQLRFFSTASDQYFSEVMLRKEADDTQLPQISGCSINNSVLINYQTARFSCNVTDNLDVASVNGTIGGTVYNFTKSGDVYYHDFQCLVTNPSIAWNLVQALDIAGNYNSTNPGLYAGCTFDITPPVLTLYSPANQTYNHSNIALDVSANEAINTWWYKLDAGANVTFTPNTTVVGAEGSNHLIVYANDSLGNIGFAQVYFTVDVTPPNITIISPLNITYNISYVQVLVTANEPILEWLHSHNGEANETFSANFTVYGLNNGSNCIDFYAYDLVGNLGYRGVCFTATYSGAPVFGNLTLELFYPPYAFIGDNVTIRAILRDMGVISSNSSVKITIDLADVSMAFDNTSNSYIVYWIPSSNGVYPFTVLSENGEHIYAFGSINVSTTYQVCISIWTNVNMTAGSEYRNEFAWIFATFQPGTETLHTIFEAQPKFECPPEALYECMWHARYVNGTACVDLFMPGNYTFWIIGNNIEWKKNIGTGFIVGCDFCEYNAISKHLLLNLGTYSFNGLMNEDFDLYYSPAELYYGGAFFGFLASWAFIIIYAIIGFLAFVFTLWATGSVKSALLMLGILPTVIHILLVYAGVFV